MDRTAQVADPLSVNDAHLQNAAPLALGQIIRYQFFEFARLKGVQIQHPVNG